ncbi:MAG: hypothetical protein JKY70_12395 [Mucilaginibacter sp.]|nr:hypothetical protein [Mucilaginibacter sp.]
MKQQEVFRKTGAIIKELLDQYEYLQETADDLNDLELELFVANTHFLKDHAEILKKLNLQRSQEQKALPPAAEDKQPEPQTTVQAELIAPLPPQPEPVEPQEPEQEQTSWFNLPKPDFLRPQAPKVETPKPEQPAPEVKAPAGEPKYFEPVVQPVKPLVERAPFIAPQPIEPEQRQPEPIEEDKPVPSINLDAGRDADTYSFQREETGTIKHDLEINEADTFTEASKDNNQTSVAAGAKIGLSSLFNNNQKSDETEQPNVVPSNPEPVIDNTPKVAAEESIPSQEPEIPVAAHETEKADEPQRPLTLNERLRAQREGDSTPIPTQQKQEAPIADLKSAISMNDKLLFVKDLFNGYSLAYSEAIEIVNRFSNFEEADRFLKTNYVAKNNWDLKKSTTDKFYALLKRRYA